MSELSLHGAFLSIESEFPENALAVRLNLGDGTSLLMFMADIDQWWALRNTLPKADDYTLSLALNIPSLRGADADAWAATFYQKKLDEKKIARPEPQQNVGSDDDAEFEVGMPF